MPRPSKTTAQKIAEFWSRVKTGDKNACWEWQSTKTADGYGCFRMAGYPLSAHRISWILANGAIPSGKYVCHSCDNPSCVNPAHLWIGSPSDNMNDKFSKGRGVRGASKKPRASKQATKDAETRAASLRKSGLTLESIGKLLGTTKQRIYQMLKKQ